MSAEKERRGCRKVYIAGKGELHFPTLFFFLLISAHRPQIGAQEQPGMGGIQGPQGRWKRKAAQGEGGDTGKGKRPKKGDNGAKPV